MNTVYDWKFYCTEARYCYVTLFDNDIGDVVYTGWLNEVPQQYQDYCVQSFDPIDPKDSTTTTLTLNIGK